MRFTEKNDFIVKNKKPEYFSEDVDLLKKIYPGSRVHDELKRLNSFNRNKIHGMVLLELLKKSTQDEILKNRNQPKLGGTSEEGTGTKGTDAPETNEEGTGTEGTDAPETNEEGTGTKEAIIEETPATSKKKGAKKKSSPK